MAQTLFYRIGKIIEKIGTNGTSIPAATYPKDRPKSNEAISSFMDAHKVVCEYLFASTAQKFAEARAKKAKEDVEKLFKDNVSKMKPGDQELHNYDNVGVLIKVANGRQQLSKDLIITYLASKSWTFPDIDKFLVECSTKTKDPVSYSCSTTVE